MGRREKEEFYRLVIIARSVFGGAAKTIDWPKIADALGGIYTPELVRSRWPKLRKIYGGFRNVEKATRRWEAVFLAAYKDGKLLAELNIKNMDIAYLAKFWKDNDAQLEFASSKITSSKGNHSKLSSLPDPEGEWKFVQEESADNWLDAVQTYVSSVKMEEHLSAVPFTYVQDEQDETDQIASLKPEEREIDEVKMLIKVRPLMIKMINIRRQITNPPRQLSLPKKINMTLGERSYF